MFSFLRNAAVLATVAIPASSADLLPCYDDDGSHHFFTNTCSQGCKREKRGSESEAQALRETDCMTLEVVDLLAHNRALSTIYFPFAVR